MHVCLIGKFFYTTPIPDLTLQGAISDGFIRDIKFGLASNDLEFDLSLLSLEIVI